MSTSSRTNKKARGGLCWLLERTFGGPAGNVFRGMAILAPLVTLRYPLALPLPRHDGAAMNLLVLSFGLMLGMTLLIGTLIWAFGGALLGLISMEVLAPWWWLIALGVLAAATYEMLTLWATRRRAYRGIAQTQVWQSAAGNLVKLALGLAALMPAGLLIGQVVAQGGGIGSLLRAFLQEFRANLRHIRITRIKKVAARHRGFPLYRVPSQFLLVFSTQAPLLFAAAIFDARITGQLSLSIMAMGLAIQLLGRTMAKAFYAEAASIGSRRPAEVRRITLEVLKRLAALGLPHALALFLFGPSLFGFVFGAEWQLAGSFASTLSIFLLFQFLQTPAAHLFYLFDRNGALLMLNLQRSLLVAGCFGAAMYFGWTPQDTVLAYALTMSGQYLATIIWSLRIIPAQASQEE